MSYKILLKSQSLVCRSKCHKESHSIVCHAKCYIKSHSMVCFKNVLKMHSIVYHTNCHKKVTCLFRTGNTCTHIIQKANFHVVNNPVLSFGCGWASFKSFTQKHALAPQLLYLSYNKIHYKLRAETCLMGWIMRISLVT